MVHNYQVCPDDKIYNYWARGELPHSPWEPPSPYMMRPDGSMICQFQIEPPEKRGTISFKVGPFREVTVNHSLNDEYEDCRACRAMVFRFTQRFLMGRNAYVELIGINVLEATPDGKMFMHPYDYIPPSFEGRCDQ